MEEDETTGLVHAFGAGINERFETEQKPRKPDASLHYLGMVEFAALEAPRSGNSFKSFFWGGGQQMSYQPVLSRLFNRENMDETERCM